MAMFTVNRVRLATLLWASLFALTAGQALAGDKPSGTIEFEEEEFRVILGGQGGKGTLHFQGREYPFKLTGITAGGIGYSKVKAKGNVYDLNSVADFSGAYVELTLGLTAVKGKGGYWVKNDKGVALHITTSQEGLELAIGAGGMNIELEE